MFEYEIPGTVLDKKADIKGSADASIENVIPDDLSRRYWIHLIYTPQVLQMRPEISKKTAGVRECVLRLPTDKNALMSGHSALMAGHP